jgi:hypothetical protein
MVNVNVVQILDGAPPQRNFVRMCKDYSALGGKPFYGTETVVEIQAWIRMAERIFRSIV